MVSKTLALSALMFVRLATLCAAEETGAPSSADNDVSDVAMHSPSSDSDDSDWTSDSGLATPNRPANVQRDLQAAHLAESAASPASCSPASSTDSGTPVGFTVRFGDSAETTALRRNNWLARMAAHRLGPDSPRSPSAQNVTNIGALQDFQDIAETTYAVDDASRGSAKIHSIYR